MPDDAFPQENRTVDFVFRSRPGGLQKGVAASLMAVLCVIVLVALVTGNTPLTGSDVLLSAYAGSMLMVEVLTAALLLTLFFAEPSLALLLLAVGYFFHGLTVLPWLLTFPGISGELGTDAGWQSTAAIAAVRRLVFPLFVLAYALIRNRKTAAASGKQVLSLVALISFPVAALTVVALGTLVVAHQDALPVFMQNSHQATALWQSVPLIAIVLSFAALALLWRKPTTIDLWLMVAIGSQLVEIVMLAYVSGGDRLSAGWWAGRLCGFLSASVLLLLMIFETMALYARLAQAIRSERRLRRSRIIEMEAMSAAIAHEIAQPVAGITMNAEAALNWLSREHPNLAETGASLDRILADGRRTAKVLEELRSVYGRAPRDWQPLEVGPLVGEVLDRHRPEVIDAKATIDAVREPGPCTVAGNRVQLDQVLSNLVLNALQAMDGISDRPRVLTVRYGASDPGLVFIAIGDTGPGIGQEDAERIFEPFMSTKPNGLGIGLVLCRSLVGLHGGRLEIGANGPGGATFIVMLPAWGAGDTRA